MAISTGLLPDEDAAGDAIILVIVVDLAIVAGKLIRELLTKYCKIYANLRDKSTNEEIE